MVAVDADGSRVLGCSSCSCRDGGGGCGAVIGVEGVVVVVVVVPPDAGRVAACVGDPAADGSYLRGRPRDKWRRLTNSLSSTIQKEPKSSS